MVMTARKNLAQLSQALSFKKLRAEVQSGASRDALSITMSSTRSLEALVTEPKVKNFVVQKNQTALKDTLAPSFPLPFEENFQLQSQRTEFL